MAGVQSFQRQVTNTTIQYQYVRMSCWLVEEEIVPPSKTLKYPPKPKYVAMCSVNVSYSLSVPVVRSISGNFFAILEKKRFSQELGIILCKANKKNPVNDETSLKVI